MAVCTECQQEMAGPDAARTCTATPVLYFPDGTSEPAVPFEADDDERCGDCGVAAGGFHHPGCDVERCPRCGCQLIGCGCLDDGDEVL